MSKYSVARTCSRKCAGSLQRKNAEANLRLDAFDNWERAMAYALGLLFSDGNITKPAKGSWRIQLTSIDQCQAQWLHTFLGNSHKIRQKQPKQKSVNGCRLVKKPQVQYLSLRGLRPQPWHQWFGLLPDKEIAQRAQVGNSNVARARKLAGYLPVSPVKKISPRSWHSLAGTMPDSHVAQGASVSPATVFHYRKKMKIPVFTRIQAEQIPSAISQEI